MAANELLRQLRCIHCNDRRICGPEDMLDELRRMGKLRREAKPDIQIILELIEHEAASLRCRACSQYGMIVEDPSDDFDFPDGRSCEVCRQLIPTERLEVFPDATRCAQCQDKPTPQGDDYCVRCGGRVEVRSHQGAGVARYVAICSECGQRQ